MNKNISNTPTVLVIDDEPIARLTLEGLLTGSGVQISFAYDGKTGLEKARELQPDAIILDVMMPGMDGYEVCRNLRADPLLSETHIIMLTALDDRDARLAGLMAGADDFISKPYDGLELQMRLKTIVRVNRHRRLLAERARFHWLVEHSEDGFLELNQSGVIQYANESVRTLLHLPENSEGLQFVQHVEHRYLPHPRETWQNWLQDPSPCYLVQPETINARAYWLLLDAMDAPFGPDTHRIVRVSNVTEKMAVQQDMRRFHTIVMHKLRTPVSLIFSSMTLLEARMDAIPAEEVKPLVQTAWRGSERLVSEVRDILNYIDAPALLQHNLPAELRELTEIASELQHDLELKSLTIQIPEEVQFCEIALTASALEVILREILENSQKFHPMRAPHVYIEASLLPSADIRICIQDDGVYLTSEQLKWAIMPYFQGEKFFTGEAKGMGLGIPTAASLVWEAGGDITIANRQDQPGVQVEITVPVAAK